VADRISSTLLFVPELLLHVSRGVRWDSDHVVTYSDDLQAMLLEIVRGNFLDRVHVGLDFFDASINRIAAWAIGTRNTIQALLYALLEPTGLLREMERRGDFAGRLALMESLKSMPFGAVWDYYCEEQGVPVGMGYIDEIRAYERMELAKR
jgi:L-rhamnose isomerase